MDENVLQQFQFETFGDNLENTLEISIIRETIYSYIVYYSKDVNETIKYTIRYTVSEVDKYNTINKNDAIENISNKAFSLLQEKNNGVLTYGQPPLELLIVLYEPLINKMVNRIKNKWSNFEVDDLAQICRMCMINLYNDGYYINKNLLWTTFKNEILMQVRPLKKRGTMISIYDLHYESNSDGDNAIPIIDTLIDTDALDKEIDDDYKDAEMQIFEEVKDICIDLIGKRQFDSFFRDYKYQHTNTTSRKLLVRIKQHMKMLGLTREDFNNKYH